MVYSLPMFLACREACLSTAVLHCIRGLCVSMILFIYVCSVLVLGDFV